MTALAAPAAPAPVRRAPSLVRAGALALLLGGPLSLVFHVLWQMGHGPTVVNEHGVVLGLTNDAWSHLGWTWMALVAVGVVAVCSLHPGRASTAAQVLLLTGLALHAASAWIWPLYSIGILVLNAGVGCLAVTVQRGAVLPRWSAGALLVAVLSVVPLVVAPDTVVASATTALPFLVQGEDVIALCAAAGWTALGLGLLRGRRA